MNFSNPILVCDENEEFRIFIREMLTRSGFFHVLEASSSKETIEILKDKQGYLVLIDSKQITNEIIPSLKSQKNFLVLIQNTNPNITNLSAKLGVQHVMSYPFPYRKLVDRIHSFF